MSSGLILMTPSFFSKMSIHAKSSPMKFALRFFCLALLASNIMAADRAVGIGPSFKGPVGLQLYSLRDEFSKNPPATLAKIQSFGIKYVETASTYQLAPAQFKEMLTAHGL